MNKRAATIEKALPPTSGDAWTTMIPPPPTDVATCVPIHKEEATVTMTNAELPLMKNIFDGYFSNRVDIRFDSHQTKTLRALLFGLQSRFARLQNGKEVTNGQDAIKWILENIG